MDRIKYENYLGAAGYDAVARRKIKELEKKVGPQTVEKVLYQTDNAEFSDMGGIYAHALSLTGGITASKTYKVELDGTSYECVCKSDKGFGEYVGNESLINPMANDTGEEFLIVHENPNDMSTGYMIMCTKQFARVKISTMEEKVEGGVFAVTAESENHLDKTYAEILDAYNAGALPILRVPALNSVFTLQDVLPTGMMAFVSFTYPGGSDIRVRKIELTADDQFTYAEGFVGQSPA